GLYVHKFAGPVGVSNLRCNLEGRRNRRQTCGAPLHQPESNLVGRRKEVLIDATRLPTCFNVVECSAIQQQFPILIRKFVEGDRTYAKSSIRLHAVESDQV